MGKFHAGYTAAILWSRSAAEPLESLFPPIKDQGVCLNTRTFLKELDQLLNARPVTG
jgi:hypothetical protein